MHARETVRATHTLWRFLGWRALFSRAHLALCACLFSGALLASLLWHFALNGRDALHHAINEQLGAPLVLRSDTNLPADWWRAAGLSAAPVQTAAFSARAVSAQAHHAVSLKAVSDGYPLRGELRVRRATGVAVLSANALAPGAAWLDGRALALLQLQLGDVLHVGRARLRVDGEIVQEPDRITQLQHVLPRVMVHASSLERSGVAAGARGEWRQLLAPTEAQRAALQDWLTQRPALNVQWLQADGQGHPLSRMAQRADRLLRMLILIALMLSGLAAALVAQSALPAWAHSATVLRALGVQRRAVSAVLWSQWLALVFIGVTLGALFGWLMTPLATGFLPLDVPASPGALDARVWALLLAIGGVTIALAVWPHAAPLSRHSVAALLHRPRPHSSGQLWRGLVVAGLCLALLWLNSDNLQLTLYLLGGALLIAAFTGGASWALVRLTGWLHRLARGRSRVLLRQLGRTARVHTLAMATAALVVMAVLLTQVLRSQFIGRYAETRLLRDGNVLFTGLPAQDLPSLRALLDTHGVTLSSVHPTVDARLLAINGLSVAQAVQQHSDTREELHSPVRLSWAEDVPANNRLLEGHWPRSAADGVSVESEVMADLGLQLGDELTFQIGEHTLTAAITSRREFRSGGSLMTFWFMFSADALQGLDVRHMGGFVAPPDARALMRQLMQQHPQTVITDLSTLVARLRAMMGAMTTAMNAVLLIILASALCVFIAVLNAQFRRDARRFGVLHALGCSQRSLLRMHALEYLTVAAVACAVGAGASWLIADAMFAALFAVPFELNGGLLWRLTAAVLLSFTGLGYLLARRMARKYTWQELAACAS